MEDKTKMSPINDDELKSVNGGNSEQDQDAINKKLYEIRDQVKKAIDTKKIIDDVGLSKKQEYLDKFPNDGEFDFYKQSKAHK